MSPCYPVVIRVSLHIHGSIEVHAAKQLGSHTDGNPAVSSLINLILAPELPGGRGLLAGVTETLPWQTVFCIEVRSGPSSSYPTGDIASLTQVHGLEVPAEFTGIYTGIATADIDWVNQSVSIPVKLAGRPSLEETFSSSDLRWLSYLTGGITFLLVLVGD